MKIEIDTEFGIGDVVYLRIDDAGNPGMITDIRLFPCNMLMYGITWTDKELSAHYAIELTTTRNFVVPETENGERNATS